VHATRWVREMLARAGLFDLLSAKTEAVWRTPPSYLSLLDTDSFSRRHS
jgi:hypothetical protein